MENMQIILIILIASVFLIAVASIPVLLQVYRVTKSMSFTLNTLNQDLPGIMKNLSEIMTRINRTTAVAHQQVEELALTVRRIQGLISIVVGVEEILRRSVSLRLAQKARTSLAFAKGVRVFLEYLVGNHR